MLVLSRKLNQEIVIGDGVTITVLAIRGNQVRLGIKAPPDVRIHRAEVLGRERPLPDRPKDGDPSGV